MTSRISPSKCISPSSFFSLSRLSLARFRSSPFFSFVSSSLSLQGVHSPRPLRLDATPHRFPRSPPRPNNLPHPPSPHLHPHHLPPRIPPHPLRKRPRSSIPSHPPRLPLALLHRFNHPLLRSFHQRGRQETVHKTLVAVVDRVGNDAWSRGELQVGWIVHHRDVGMCDDRAALDVVGRLEGQPEVVVEALRGEGDWVDRRAGASLHGDLQDSLHGVGFVGGWRWIHELRIPAYVERTWDGRYVCW